MKSALRRVATPHGLIITADDFGLHPRINAAVESAHRDGVLTAASLMVAVPAARDAVERARRMPELKVGLHIVVVDGPAVLTAAELPLLLNDNSDFAKLRVRDGFRFLRRRVRTQLEAEIRAQFEAPAPRCALTHPPRRARLRNASRSPAT